MKPPGPIALQAMRDAIANVGVREEGGENRGKAVAIYLASVGLPEGYEWCCAHVHYRIYMAAKKLKAAMPPVPHSGYTPDWASWARRNGLWIDAGLGAEIMPGDLAFFYRPEKRRIGHTGIVIEPVRSTLKDIKGFRAVEANVDADGDGIDEIAIMNRTMRDLTKWGGFVRIPY